jgi:hypothetical protein
VRKKDNGKNYSPVMTSFKTELELNVYPEHLSGPQNRPVGWKKCTVSFNKQKLFNARMRK